MTKLVYDDNEGGECGLLLCDFCGAEGGDKHLSVEDSYQEAIDASGWYAVGKKHICHNCYTAADKGI